MKNWVHPPVLLAALCALATLAVFLAGCSSGSAAKTPTITPAESIVGSLPTGTHTQMPPTGAGLATSTAPASQGNPTAAPTLKAEPPTATFTPTPGLATVSELPDPAGYAWNKVADGLEQPVGIVNAGDGSGRLFILEQAGKIRILKDGNLLPLPFLDLSQEVSCCGERGLLGLAFHPKFTQNGYFYIDYTGDIDGQLTTVIARFQISGDNPDQADPSSELRILLIKQPYENHNGGQLQFGPDGYLYIGMGDGGSGGDPNGNGQSLDTLLGKILRIDVDSKEPYAIPPDNPFAKGGGLPEIWAYGLRNPWRFSFDKLTGDMYIADVGQNRWEEIDYLPAGSTGGQNLGWNFYEGSHPFEGSPPAGARFVMPVAEYGHDMGISVTGGYVYRGSQLPAWEGVYLYGDYGSGKVWALLRLPDGTWKNSLMYETGYTITSFGIDEHGEIYLADYNGNIFQLK